MTPYEISLLLREYKKVLDDQYNLMVANAWYTAAFERQRKLPKLNKFLKKEIDMKKIKETRKWLEEMIKNG